MRATSPSSQSTVVCASADEQTAFVRCHHRRPIRSSQLLASAEGQPVSPLWKLAGSTQSQDHQVSFDEMAKSTSSLASCSSSSSSSSRSSSIKSTQSSSSSSSSSSSLIIGDNKLAKWTQNSQMDRRKRLAANARERKRMHLLNKAYDQLRRRLVDAENKSKYDVLVQAKEYIQALATICEKFDQQQQTGHQQPRLQMDTSQQTLPNYHTSQPATVHMTPSPDSNELRLKLEAHSPDNQAYNQMSPIALIKQENKLNDYYQDTQVHHLNQSQPARYPNFYHNFYEQSQCLHQHLDPFGR